MKIVQKLISMGADISTKKALKIALKTIGAKEENVDRIYVELKNSVNRDYFMKVPMKDRIITLPACLRDSKRCGAKLTKEGYRCVMCGMCKIGEIKKRAEKAGTNVFIVPGGSMALAIVKRHKPKAVLGVACLNELVGAAENIHVPAQGVRLLKKGCIDTDVNVEEVFSVLEGNGNNFNAKRK